MYGLVLRGNASIPALPAGSFFVGDSGRAAEQPVTVVLNWPAALARLNG